jgi:hypothetical protein
MVLWNCLIAFDIIESIYWDLAVGWLYRGNWVHELIVCGYLLGKRGNGGYLAEDVKFTANSQ